MPAPIYVGANPNPYGRQAMNFLSQMAMAKVAHKMRMEEMSALSKMRQAEKGKEATFEAALQGSDIFRTDAEKPPEGYFQNPWDTTTFIEGPGTRKPRVINLGHGILGVWDRGKIVNTFQDKSQKFDVVAQSDLGDRVRVWYQNGATDVFSKGPVPTKQNEGFKDETTLRKEFQTIPEVKEYAILRQQVGRADQAIKLARQGKGSMNAVDQSLITILNKMLDPSSVVRESEYARTPQGTSVINRLEGYKDKLSKGGAGINPSEREAIWQMTQKLYKVQEDLYNKQAKFYTGLAKSYGMQPERVVRLGLTQGETGYEPPTVPPKPGDIIDGYIFRGGNPNDDKNYVQVK